MIRGILPDELAPTRDTDLLEGDELSKPMLAQGDLVFPPQLPIFGHTNSGFTHTSIEDFLIHERLPEFDNLHQFEPHQPQLAKSSAPAPESLHAKVGSSHQYFCLELPEDLHMDTDTQSEQFYTPGTSHSSPGSFSLCAFTNEIAQPSQSQWTQALAPASGEATPEATPEQEPEAPVEKPSKIYLPLEETQKREERLKEAFQATTLHDFQKRYISDAQFRKSHHMMHKNNKKCTTCRYTFSTTGRHAFHYHDHGRQENKRGEKREFCPEQDCPMAAIGFCTRQSVIRHVKTVHGNVKLECSRCGRVFSRRDGIRRHFESRICNSSKGPAKRRQEPSLLDYFEQNPVMPL